ncbi:MAG: patatin-like phospholipase family protein [Treponema sp.]|nr:patatin-like phospholipase family protein [Treponema sp.]
MEEERNSGKKTFKILSIDGGGILGLYSVDVLDRIQREYCNGRPLSQDFNLITGTSTGGIIALGLAIGKSAEQIKEFYLRYGESIFPKNRRKRPGVFKQKYSKASLKNALKEFFGNQRIKDCKTAVCIPSINAATCQPIIFKTNNNGSLTRDEDFSIVDIALATSAAPTYFPMHSFENFLGLVDGGLWQNNPALCGAIEAISYFVGEGKEFDSMKILSIGNPSSVTRSSVYTKKHNSGIWNWKQNLVHLPMKVTSVATHQILQILHRNNALNIKDYLRIEPNNLTEDYKNLKLDSADDQSYKKLQELSFQDFNQNKHLLQKFFKEEEL